MTKTTKTTKKTETKKTETKTVKKTVAQVIEEMRTQIHTSERIQFETEETAVNKLNSATITQDNCIMLTLVSDDNKKASRVVEIWGHRSRFDVCISKRSFDAVAETKKALASYKERINDKAKSSKYVFVIESEKECIKFVNLYLDNI